MNDRGMDLVRLVYKHVEDSWGGVPRGSTVGVGSRYGTCRIVDERLNEG